jgi:hypothetical protein
VHDRLIDVLQRYLNSKHQSKAERVDISETIERREKRGVRPKEEIKTGPCDKD